jgi:hypothetical protein
VDAPDGTRVNDEPAQTDPLFTVITGKGLTVTFETTAETAAQPALLVPVTV